MHPPVIKTQVSCPQLEDSIVLFLSLANYPNTVAPGPRANYLNTVAPGPQANYLNAVAPGPKVLICCGLLAS